MEDGKENGILTRTGKSKPFPAKLLLILGLFLAFALTVFVVSVSTIKYTGLQSVVTTVTSGFVTCREDEPNSLSKWIQPPAVLMHNMSDEELLWRASFWPRRKEYPFQRVAEWGRMTMCDAEKRLLANALLDISNEWFVLVSESCIPLFNFTTIYSYLSRSKHSFMGAFDDPGPFGRGRYNHNMEPEVPITKWRKGSQWFEINRELAATIVKDTLYYPKFKEFCRPACYVDEHYFPTMLTIEKPMALANRSLTWVDWSRGGPHPATFGRSDITEKFFEKILDGKNCIYNGRNTSMCYLFARKFAPSALESLLHIAPKILGY
ncbi:hypothetical protein DY000_02019213 [Brassica cretica]|uniref:Core-2/I-branching beta-1,6-N-acetylglucosaminyltransferase family protein n=1 Tax=Brassica cretica TaxID=69181 RepID=A0ABQ7CUP8_BRACR|nr:hypothetical protein DY000_02019213 [Brassica cretica]